HLSFISYGSVFTTILMSLTSVAFGFYVSKFAKYNELYGSIGTLLVIMIYIWINCMILLLGFELNAAIYTAKRKNAYISNNKNKKRMKNVLATLVLTVLTVFTIQAQTITGKWKTIDDETGEAKSIVEITEKNGKYYGKILEILTDKKDAKCDKCPGADKGKPI